MKQTFNTTKPAVKNPVNIYSNTRTERQHVSIQKWQYGGYKGILHITPRFGKTRLGIKAAEVYLSYPNTKQVLVITPSQPVVNQWNDELFNYESTKGLNKSHIQVISFNSYKNLTEKTLALYGLLIYDEIHKYITDNALVRLRNDIPRKSVIGLTGTLPDDKTFSRTLQPLLPVLDVITEKEATDNKWINPYTEYNVALNFKFTDQYNYVKYSKFITETNQLFKNMSHHLNKLKLPDNVYFGFKSDYAVIVACKRGAKNINNGKYIQPNVVRDYIGASKGWSTRLDLHRSSEVSIDTYWSSLNIYNRVSTFMDFVEKRNTIIGTSNVKLQAILKIIETSIDVPTIIYVHSTDFAEEVVETINNVNNQKIAIAYHSQIKSRPLINPETNEYYLYKSGAKKDSPKIFGKTLLRRMYLEGLQKGLFKILVTVASLNEGLNVPKLARVILTAGSQNNITYQQRKARVFTIDPENLAKESTVINLYFDDFLFKGVQQISRDKIKLLKRQKDNNSTPIYIRQTDILN